MAQHESKQWWERVRGKNRSLKGLISARRRYSARMDRLEGKQPTKRQYSVPAIARRIGTPLAILKRVIREQDEASPALLMRLAKDLDMPVRELKAIMEEGDARTGAVRNQGRNVFDALNGDGTDPFQALEDGLISSAKALVELLRNCSGQGQGAPRSVKRPGR